MRFCIYRSGLRHGAPDVMRCSHMSSAHLLYPVPFVPSRDPSPEHICRWKTYGLNMFFHLFVWLFSPIEAFRTSLGGWISWNQADSVLSRSTFGPPHRCTLPFNNRFISLVIFSQNHLSILFFTCLAHLVISWAHLFLFNEFNVWILIY